MTAAPTTPPVQAHLETILEELRGADAGEVASYIPELGRADPDWFSICLCTTDGHVYEVGDSDVEFTIQSMSKPFIYGAALAARGREEVLARVGVEPSGEPFNAIAVDTTQRPFNPMVNAGAIVTTAMVAPDAQVLDVLSRYAGRPLTVDEAVFESERSTGDRNRAIAFLMRSFGTIDADADAAVDRYFRQCSVNVTCRDLAVMGATLANRGHNPMTGVVAVDEPLVESVLSVMSSCGMYDASGEWMFRIGLPAKSGVSGGVIAVLPGQFGIGVFSPRLDARGNTTRGIEVCERIALDFDLHPMRFQPDVGGVIRRTYTCAEVHSNRLRTGAEIDLLAEHGSSARVFELQGELYLGTAERVTRHIIDAIEQLDVVILDLTRVTRSDDASRGLLAELRAQLDAVDCRVVLAGIAGEPDVDVALEECEDRILEAAGHAATAATSDLASQELLAGLSDAELGAVAAATRLHRLRTGDAVFKQGDPADSIFFILSGALAVLLPLDAEDGGNGSTRRLARMGAGLAVGEMALVGDSARSAHVEVSQDAELAELPVSAVAALTSAHPDLALHLHRNLAHVLADRLRRANEQLRLEVR
jgi:glutaminase